jgi:protease I
MSELSSANLEGALIAFLAADGVEESELTAPWHAVEQAGGQPVLVSIEKGEIQAFVRSDKSRCFHVDAVVEEADADDFDALVLPGGVANPDRLRLNHGAVAFARAFVEAGKPVAVICHGPWILVEADVVRGRRITSFPSLRADIVNAGGEWVDEEVCLDRPLISSRGPDDLPALCIQLVEEIAEHRRASSPLDGVPRRLAGACS